MQRSRSSVTPPKSIDTTINDLQASHDAGGDPRRIIAQLNRRIVDCQRAGADLPSGYLGLSRRLTADYFAQNQDRL